MVLTMLYFFVTLMVRSKIIAIMTTQTFILEPAQMSTVFLIHISLTNIITIQVVFVVTL